MAVRHMPVTIQNLDRGADRDSKPSTALWHKRTYLAFTPRERSSRSCIACRKVSAGPILSKPRFCFCFCFCVGVASPVALHACTRPWSLWRRAARSDAGEPTGMLRDNT